MNHLRLERLLRSPGQIAVLRALWSAPVPLTGRQVQRLARVHNRTAMEGLHYLEELGLVQRRAVGRSYLCSLKRSHRVVRTMLDPMFKAEVALPQRLAQDLARFLKGGCLSAVLYGSVARGEAGPRSDVDLLIIVEDDLAARTFAGKRQDKAEQVAQECWSLVLEMNVKTRRELARDWDSDLMKEIRREGQLVVGSPLEEIRNDRASQDEARLAGGREQLPEKGPGIRGRNGKSGR